MSIRKYVRPWCFFGASGSVRATSMHHFEYCAIERPDLLAGDDPLVAVLHRARLQRGEVGAGVGLAEALAPDLLGGEDRDEVALLLLRRAPRHDRRAGEQQAEHVRRQRRAGSGQLLVEDRRLRQRRAAAAVLGRPVHRRPAAVGEPPLPVAPPRVVRVLVAVRRVARRVRREPRAQLVAEGGLLLR